MIVVTVCKLFNDRNYKEDERKEPKVNGMREMGFSCKEKWKSLWMSSGVQGTTDMEKRKTEEGIDGNVLEMKRNKREMRKKIRKRKYEMI